VAELDHRGRRVFTAGGRFSPGAADFQRAGGFPPLAADFHRGRPIFTAGGGFRPRAADFHRGRPISTGPEQAGADNVRVPWDLWFGTRFAIQDGVRRTKR